MVKKLNIIYVVLLFLSSLVLGQAFAAPTSGKDQSDQQTAAKKYKEAVSDPLGSGFKTYLGSLAKAGQYYVYEGDMLLTESEVRTQLVAQSTAPSPAQNGELLVSIYNGGLDYWAQPSDRTLTYAVDRSSFATKDQYDQVVENMRHATDDWMSLCPECGIKFIHSDSSDSAPSHQRVTFIVREYNAGGQFIAASFFPHDPPDRRNLNLDPSYFTTTFDHVGVLRHELGHILGYRHEHIRGIPGCYMEDNQWRPITPYDPHSVMHYFCGGGGTMSLNLTALDRQGHHALYAPRADANAAALSASNASALTHSSASVAIYFEGGRVARNAALVFSYLNGRGLLPTTTHIVRRGETLCSVVRTEMNFPAGCSQTFLQFESDLNPQMHNLHKLQAGDSVTCPNLRFGPSYELKKILDPQITQDRIDYSNYKSAWKNKITSVRKGANIVLAYNAYQVSVPIDSIQDAQVLEGELWARRLPNVRYDVPDGEGPAKNYFSIYSPNDFLFRCRNNQLQPTDQGWYSSMIDARQLPSCAVSCASPPCAEVILADTPVYQNPDIATALENGISSNNVPPSTNSRCREIAFDPKLHHGTHLASIIVSQYRAAGLIGLAPAAHLYSFDWDHDTFNGAGLAHEIESRNANANEVYLFASEWNFPNSLKTGNQLNVEESRFSPLVASRIRDYRPLFIAAAGQADPIARPNEQALRLRTDTARGPMNLGDQRNVMIVTACENCDSNSDARLLPEANYSEWPDNLVQVAAPGKDIPGDATANEYAHASGTSQAAAFVAGTAAAMYNCFPRFYTKPEIVKTRIQVTSRPVLTGQDAKRVATGIVDMELALKDPNSQWLQLHGGNLQTADIEGWCVSGMEMQDPDTQESQSYVRTSDIYRIVRSTAGPTPSGWVLYNREGWDPYRDRLGKVLRTGPGILQNSNTPLLKLKGKKEPLTLSDIDDLLIQPISQQVDCTNR